MPGCSGGMNERVKITWVADYASANTTDVNGTGVNMAGYEGVIFIAKYGTAAADNVLLLEGSSDDAGSDAYAELTGTQLGAGASDEVQWVEIYRPGEKWVRCVAERGTSSTLLGIVAIQYGAASQAVDNTIAGTIHGEYHVSPAEGTA